MPSASEFSATPANNTTIGGLSVAENATSPASVNDVLRYLAAAMRSLYDSMGAGDSDMPVTGGAFTGDISRDGQGAYLHHAGSGQQDGRVFIQVEGSPRPSAAEGTIAFYYAS